jgi:hypothetical protein
MMKQEVGFLSVREWCDNMRARDPASSEAARIEKLSHDAHEEGLQLERGTVIDAEMVTWAARKK